MNKKIAIELATVAVTVAALALFWASRHPCDCEHEDASTIAAEVIAE